MEQSYDAAFACFRVLAERENAEACYRLAMCYFNGWGTRQSYEEAAECLRRSAEREFPEAEYELGRMYLSRLGVEQSDREGAEWVRKASDHGLRKAYGLMRRLIDDGIAEPVSDDYYALLSIFSED